MKKKIELINLRLTEALLENNHIQVSFLRNRLAELIEIYKKQLVK